MKKLPEIEWNFNDVPDEQVWICVDWEFGRTKTLSVDPCFENDPKLWEGQDYIFSFFAPDGHFPPPWPHSPFMALERWLREDMGSRMKTIYGVDPLPISALIDWDPERSSCESHIRRNDSCYVATFQIDWQQSNTAIKKAFAAWVDENEPEEMKDKKIESRGRKSGREDLEALGIYRILQHHQCAVSKIIPIYEETLAARFSSEGAWSKAKKRAAGVLKSFH